jgi:hypothetical protein
MRVMEFAELEKRVIALEQELTREQSHNSTDLHNVEAAEVATDDQVKSRESSLPTTLNL